MRARFRARGNGSDVLSVAQWRHRRAAEELTYVVAFDPTGAQRDAMTVVDCDGDSSTYGEVDDSDANQECD